jgi:hypothetical protein
MRLLEVGQRDWSASSISSRVCAFRLNRLPLAHYILRPMRWPLYLQTVAATFCSSRDEIDALIARRGSSSRPLFEALRRIFSVDHPFAAVPYFLTCIRDEMSLA